jgi:RimJ/RimL family protein N-acetyltransferase
VKSTRWAIRACSFGGGAYNGANTVAHIQETLPMTTTLATPRGPITIRLADDADADALNGLRLEALRDYPTAFTADYAAALEQPPNHWAERLRQLAGDRSGVIVLACHATTPVGMTGIRRDAGPKIRHNAMIWGVYVQPAWRGLRVAQAMIEACVEWAQAQGLRQVRLGVETDNAAARRCYERCGFVAYGVEPEQLFYAGVYYDLLLMARRLDGQP